MNIDTATILQYDNITDETINGYTNALVTKSYVDRCFYPFSAPKNGVISGNAYIVTPSILDSYWVIKDFGVYNGTVAIDFSNADSDVVTFELMIIKTDNDTGTISFDSNIKWLGGEIPQITANQIYFLVFRAIRLNNSWVVVGNNQGNVSINE